MRNKSAIDLPLLTSAIIAALTIAALTVILTSSTAIAGWYEEDENIIPPIHTPAKYYFPTDDSGMNEGNPTVTYGDEYNMYVGYDNQEYLRERSYLKFNLIAVPDYQWDNFDNAILWIKNKYGPSIGEAPYTGENMLIVAKAVENDNWSESTICWNNAPSLGSALDTTKALDDGTVDLYTWYTFDVTSFVRDQIENDPNRIVTIALQAENAENNLKDVVNWYYSKDAGDENRFPRLVLNGLTIPYNIPRITPEIAYRDAPPGSTVKFQVKVRNTGDSWDNILLSAGDDAGWSLSITPKLEIENGKQGTATLEVDIPPGANYRVQDNIKITATSEGDNTLSDSENVQVYTSTWIQPPQDDRQVITEAGKRYLGDTIYWLYVGANDENYGDERVYVKFDLNQGGFPVDENENILLYLYCYEAGPEELGYNVELYKCDNDNWYEETVGSRENAWERQPKKSFPPADLIGTENINRENAYYSWNVTEFVNQELKGDNIVTFVLKAENAIESLPNLSADNFSYGFYSKGADSLAQQPYLAFGPRPVASYVTENEFGGPGDTVKVDAVIYNRGAVVDNYDVTIENTSENWVVSPSVTTLYDVLPGENRIVEITVTIPDNAEWSYQENLKVTVTSQLEPGYQSSTTDYGVGVGRAFTHDLTPGSWNLISFPYESDNNWPSYFLRDATSSSIWYWDAVEIGYKSPDPNAPVQLGMGYWLKTDLSEIETVGLPQENHEISLVPDKWNLISFPVTSASSTPKNILENASYYSIWYWDAVELGYKSPDPNAPVQLGVGYWLKTDLSSVKVPY